MFGRTSTIRCVAPASTYTENRPAVLLALFITGFGTFVNLYITQPLLPEFRQTFRASELMVSLTVSGPILAVALAAPILGVIADTLGRKRVIVTAMICLAIPTALAAMSQGLWQFIAWRFIQGFFIPGIIPVAIAYINEEFPTHAVGIPMSTYVTGTVVGGFAGRFFAGIISAHYDWRTAFVVLGFATFAAAVATWALLPRSTRFVRKKGAADSLRSLRKHIHNPRLLATYAVGFNVLFCLVAAFTYVNFYLADKPFYLGPAALGSIFAVYLIGAVITPVAGAVLDRIGYRRTLMCASLMIASGMLLTLVQNLSVIIAGLAIASSGVFVCQSASSSHIGKAAGEALSSAAGLYVSLYYLGGCMGSIAPGFFWHKTGWLGCVVLVLVMQAVTSFIANKYWMDS
ncbi:MAG: MFS transporter [Desulfobacteraceae bacterium]|nr:MFS transporter [Desulfobacteraceae bacterium]